MRDDQAKRYARHVMLPDVGAHGQAALLAATAKLRVSDEPRADMIAGAYLAAGGVGTLVISDASDAQRAELASHGVDTEIVDGDTGREVTLAQRPPWWPAAPGDDESLAFWRGSLAATRWMAAVAKQ